MIKNIKDSIIGVLFNIFGIAGTIFGELFQYKLGILLGFFIRLFMTKRREVTKKNLRLAFPNKSSIEITNMANESFKNLGISAVEIASMKFMSDKRILDKIVSSENESIFEEARMTERPLMFLSSHFNNWELIGFYSAKTKNITTNMIIKKQSNAIIDREINKIRARAGTKTIDMDSAARKIIPIFRNGGFVAMIADQSARGEKGVLFPQFFNIPSATYASPAYLCLKFNAIMIFVVVIRNKVGKYKLYFEKIESDDLKCDDEGVKILTQRHTTALENIIRQHPTQWVWQHKRWKRMPKGTSDVY